MTGLVRRAAAILVALSFLSAAPVSAQSTGAAAPAPTAAADRAPAGPEALVLADRRGVRPPPLGAEMFEGAPPSTTNTVVDPGYVVKPGDKIRVTLWGLVNSDQEMTVDSQGNVVVPGVGPVRVGGLTATQAPEAIERASRGVYSAGVQVYAAPVASAPVQVLVTGPVERPGAYAGASDDAVVVYLQRAGGIDADRGSYRRIRVVRAGQTIADTDLYDFLASGASPRVSFRNGDAIVVGEQGPVVSVSGQVRSPFTFELAASSGQGAEIVRFARPRPGATHAAVVGVRDGQPYSAYLPLDQFAGLQLVDGDRVQFETDVRAEQILVRVEGAHSGPSVFSVSRGSTVNSVLAQVGVDGDADMSAIHLRRDSVRQSQRALIQEGLDRLERQVLTTPASSPSVAQARSQSLAFVTEFIQRARNVEPLGILAIADQDLNQVRLETGDVIVIPKQSQVVTIAGEVNAPQSVIANGGNLSSYIAQSGGFTGRADRRRVLVFAQDGRVRSGGVVRGGDRILVMTKPDSTLVPLIRDLTQIAFQTAGVFLAIDRASN